MKCRIELSLCLCLFLTFSGPASGQAAEQFRTLVVNDYSGKVALLEMGDKTYIELRRLAEVAHGSIAYEGSRVILTLPGAAASAPASSR